jgi:hypothetical protein
VFIRDLSAIMQSCWRQIGDVLKAEREFAFAALAREASRVLQTKQNRGPRRRGERTSLRYRGARRAV